MSHMESRMQDQISGAQSENERLLDELSLAKQMIIWSYTKLHARHFHTQEDALMLDRLKNYLEHGLLT